MGKHNTTLTAAAAIIADEYGIKPSRTVRQVRALASLPPQDVAPRKGSEGRRPETEVKDWENPVWHGPSSWGYVVQGAPKRVISLPDDRPDFWSAAQGEILLGHVIHAFAHSVGEEFELRGDRWVSRVSPVAVVQRYLRMFPTVKARLTDHVDVTFTGWDKITASFLAWDDVAEDVAPASKWTYGSARELVEFLKELDYKAEEEGRRGRNYR
jgi:hypothetical protein